MYFERQNIATVVVGQTYPHLEKIQPPRALWVPFEMGRPLGGYSANGEWQRKVLLQALALLEREGPVVLAEFEGEDPAAVADENWQPPALNGVADAQSAATSEAFLKEVTALQPLWQSSVDKLGNTRTGLSQLSVEEAAGFLQRFADEVPLNNPDDTMSDILRMRFCADDIRSYYIEAALSGDTHPSSKQIGDWFWNSTQAGKLLNRIRQQNLEHEQPRRQHVCSKFMVPGARL